MHLPPPSTILTTGLGLAIGATGVARLLDRLPRPDATSEAQRRRIGGFEVVAGALLLAGATRPRLGATLTAAGTALLARDLAGHDDDGSPVVLGALTATSAVATLANIVAARPRTEGPSARRAGSPAGHLDRVR